MLICGPRTGVVEGVSDEVADGTPVAEAVSVALAEAVGERTGDGVVDAVAVALGTGVAEGTGVTDAVWDAVGVAVGVTVASSTMIVPVMPDDALDRYAYDPATWKSSTKLAPGRIGPEFHRPDTASTLWTVTELVLVQRTVSPR